MRTIDLVELAREGGFVEGEVDAAALPRLASLLSSPMGRIRYRLDGRIDERGRSGAVLRINAHLGLNCDLCGERLEWDVNETEGFFFVDDEAQLGAFPIEPDGDEPLVASRTFDLRGLVEEQTILALPISPRHDACEGRPRAPLPDKADDGPFAALARLKRGRSDIQ